MKEGCARTGMVEPYGAGWPGYCRQHGGGGVRAAGHRQLKTYGSKNTNHLGLHLLLLLLLLHLLLLLLLGLVQSQLGRRLAKWLRGSKRGSI